MVLMQRSQQPKLENSVVSHHQVVLPVVDAGQVESSGGDGEAGLVDVEMVGSGLDLLCRRDLHPCKKLLHHGSWLQLWLELEKEEDTSEGLNVVEVGVDVLL